MATDHAGTATFQGQETFRDAFLIELADAINLAVELSGHEDTPLNVEQAVMVQINGFFEDAALGVSDDTPLKMWSTHVSLEEYLARGPGACLRGRLKRIQPLGLDDSSISSFDSRHSFTHLPTETEHDDQPKHLETQQETKQATTEPRLARPPMRQSRSFITPENHFSPEIHITEAGRDGYFDRDRPISESPPPPVERKRKSSIAKVLGLAQRRAHKHNTSDLSSQGSSSRPAS